MKALDRPRSAILTPLMFSSRHNSRLDRMRDLVSYGVISYIEPNVVLPSP